MTLSHYVASLLDRLLDLALGREPGPNRMVGKGRITVTEYRMETVRRFVPEWDTLDRETKLERLETVPAAGQEIVTNTQLSVFHEHIVDVFDPNQSVTALSASHLRLGTSSTSPAYGDTGLGNEVYQEAVDTSTDNGNDLTTTTLLDESEGNGNTFTELGLASASSGGTFFNHALISDKEKTSDNTLTFEVELQFRAA